MGYVMMVWSPAGYTLRELDGDPPELGQEFEEGEQTLVITKVGASPLPGDSRTCVFSIAKL